MEQKSYQFEHFLMCESLSITTYFDSELFFIFTKIYGGLEGPPTLKSDFAIDKVNALLW